MTTNANDIPSLKPPKIDWTEERIKELAELCAAGTSAREVAEILTERWGLTSPLTRNSVIGCYYRHVSTEAKGDAFAARLERNRKKPTNEERAARQSIIDDRRVRALQKRLAIEVERQKQEEVLVAPGSFRIEDMKDDQCRYIPGNDHLYCGHVVAPGGAYCAAHRTMIYNR